MARPLRLEFPGALYHITSRGNARQDIFLATADRTKFLTVLADVLDRYNWVCHGYCLMGNHYHLLVETIDANLALGMRQLNGQYTQAFNHSHQRVGHVFQGRYKSIIVEKEAHLLQLCRYIVLNPVAAGMVKKPSEWKWSSYLATAQARKDDGVVSVEWILSQFSSNAEKAQQRYQQFVAEGIMSETPWRNLKGQVYLGGVEFVAKMQTLVAEKQGIKEIPRQQRYPGRPPLKEIFQNVTSKTVRNQLVADAHVSYGYTLKEIADLLGIHYTTVSKAVKIARKKI